MIDIISLEAMEERFSDVHSMMENVRKGNQQYTFKDGRLIVQLPVSYLVVECVADILMYTAVWKPRWDKFHEWADEYSIGYESMVCYLTANRWGHISAMNMGLFTTYLSTMKIEQTIVDIDAYVEAYDSAQNAPTIYGDVLYALVGVADAKPSWEYGVSDTTTIYGLFTNLKSLRAAYEQVKERIQTSEDDSISSARHEFAIHAFVPNRCFGLGTEVSSSFFID